MYLLLRLLMSFCFAEQVFFDDMVVDMSEQPKGASLLHVELWEDGILPIRFESYLPKEKRELFMQACNEWAQVANIKCVEGYYKNRIIDVTTYLPGCWATWGMGTHYGVLSRQINLEEKCWSKRVVLHELGHTLGLIHEHQRPDRDSYIEIKYENMKSSLFDTLKIINYDLQEIELSTPYDYFSIMHYHSHSGSKDAVEPVIVPKTDDFFVQIYMGWVERLSKLDGQIVSRLYGAPKKEEKIFSAFTLGSSTTQVWESSTVKPNLGSQVFKPGLFQ